MRRVGEPITVTLALGGMRGPEGSISRASFDRRRAIELTALVQEDHVPHILESKESCVELGRQLGEALYDAAVLRR